MSRPTCPMCGCHRFEIRVMQSIMVEFTSKDEHEVYNGPTGDMEWGEETEATCRECDHVAPLGEMKKKRKKKS